MEKDPQALETALLSVKHQPLLAPTESLFTNSYPPLSSSITNVDTLREDVMIINCLCGSVANLFNRKQLTKFTKRAEDLDFPLTGHMMPSGFVGY